MNRSQIIGSLSVVLLVAASAYFWFGRSYGEVSQRGYAYAKAMFLACNQKDTEKLRQISEMIQKDSESGELHQQEKAWLQEIIQLGLDENWVEANRQVRQLMNDQIQEVP